MGEPVATVDIGATRAALRRAAGDVAALVASAPDPDLRIPDSVWSLGDVAAHLAIGAEAYARYATGATEVVFDVSDIAGGSLSRTSAALLQAEPQRDLGVLAGRIETAATALLDATDERPSDERVTWNGQEIGLGALLGLGLAEFVLHGRDLAKALGRPWTIRPDDARLVLAAALPIVSLLVDPVATKGVHAVYDVSVRGGTRVALVIDDGDLTVGDAGRPVDCHVSADPVALLLVAYGRTSQWGPILTGKLVAWGRKPWLGPRLTGYLVAP